ncbi:MAG: alanyl-tRNA editing protein [Nitrososphaerota archaeon]
MLKQGATELLYLDDSYLVNFDARVLEIIDGGVILDRTAFHPRGGGLVSDSGVIIHSSGQSQVKEALMDEKGVIHILEGSLPSVDEYVRGQINWEKRYKIMRMHTALHVLASVVISKTNALVTGNNVTPEIARVDFGLANFDRKIFEECVSEANEEIKKGREVRISYMEREKVLSSPGLVKLAERLPPNIPVLRVVEIVGLDIQADGGPHVRNTCEIGEIVLVKLENKGKTNKRAYISLK